MEARGLITRKTSPSDRRSFLIRLTRAGKTKAAKIHRLLERLEAGALRGSDPESVAGCNRLLGSVEQLSQQ